MSVFALDLAVNTGWAHGEPGAVPASGAVRLKKPGEGRDIAFSNLMAFLSDRWSAERPALVVKEAMLPLEAFRTIGNAESTVRMHAGMHAIVEGMCVRYGIDWREASDSTIRKHFLGKGRLGDRASTKAAVVERCHVLRLMPRDVTDDNRADALAVHDFACATFCRRSVSVSTLHMFGEQAQ